MATTTLKEQYPGDIGDGALTITTYATGNDSDGLVAVSARQDHYKRGSQAAHLILKKQDLIDALKSEEN